ncbi:MAG: hypothetical protein VB997_06930 [Opitutales bacterium]
MIGVDGDKVIIQLVDKKSFIFPLSLLSPLDQAYVRIMRSRFTRPKLPSLTPSSPGTIFSPKTLPVWSPVSRDEWWETHKNATAWRSQAPVILESLRAIWSDRTQRSAREGRDFFNWFGHWRWLDLFARSRLDEAGEAYLPAFVAIGRNETVRDVFIRALHPKDNQPRALELFVHFHVNHPELVAAHPQLAAAFAIVFDQPFPRDWPHHQVLKSDVPKEPINLAARFADFVVASKARSLEYDPAQLSVAELKFVVDHLMPKSEMEWARKNVSLRRATFDKAFKSIQYDKPRLSGGVFRWPNGSYTLAAIRERGGICVDQAYFSSMTGKAKGIPTLTFTGQGSGGGHAWFGFLKSFGRWETDCGRYESQNYPVGNAIDPQTWEKITDEELATLARGEKNLTGFRAKAVDYFEWARANPDEAFHRESIQRARKLHPGYVEAWRSEADWVEKNAKDPRERRNFWNEWVNAFTRSVDLKIEGQKSLADAYEAMGNPREAEKIRGLIIRQNRSKRFDLGILAGAEQLLASLENEDWPGAEKQYERLIRDFQKTAGGELFYKLVRPYVQTLAEAGQKAQARAAIDYLKKRDALDLGPGSIIGREMKKLEAKLGG